MSHDAAPRASPQPAYESSDAHPRAIAAWLVALALTTAGVVLLVGALMRSFEARAVERDPAVPLRGERPPPVPGLQARPADDLARQRARDAQRLGEYAWVDRPAGRVRLPIERAMELVLERGLPAREQASPGGGEERR